MYLYDDKSLFKDGIIATAEYLNLPIAIVEKDYYVTIILKFFSKRTIDCVFKGTLLCKKTSSIVEPYFVKP